MPNIASVLKEEIVRLCRKELKRETLPIRKTTATHRSDLADLKRQLAAAHKRIQVLERAAAQSSPRTEPVATGKPIRFVAKGIRPLRQRLGVSAAGLATLLGVSEQSIYNWESKKTVPRREQVAALAALRGIGKREAQARLAAG